VEEYVYYWLNISRKHAPNLINIKLFEYIDVRIFYKTDVVYMDLRCKRFSEYYICNRKFVTFYLILQSYVPH